VTVGLLSFGTIPQIPQNVLRAIVIDHTKVPTSDKTNFPVLVKGTYAYLANVAFGGSVQSASAFDIIFYADAAKTTKLKWEADSYNPVTGAVAYWVMIPTVSHTADTVFYMYYGDATITTDQSNKTAVWDANYKAVYHAQPGAGFTRSPTNPVMSHNQASWNAAQLEEPIVFTDPLDSTKLIMIRWHGVARCCRANRDRTRDCSSICSRNVDV
jgi:hypothetical protein